MIAKVSGTVAGKDGERLVIDTAAGVAYEVIVARDVLEQLPEVGSHIELATYLVVREDGWSLYGFSSQRDRRVFDRLIGVTGVGPRLALSMISGLGTARLLRALRERDIAVLSSVSGVGKRTAERLAVELADKLDDFEIEPVAPVRTGPAQLAQQALLQLGYSATEAETALRTVLANDGGSDASTLIKQALQRLARA